MLLREKLTPKIEPPKNLKPPSECENLPIHDKNSYEDKRLKILFIIFGVLLLVVAFFIPSDEVNTPHTVKYGDFIEGENYSIIESINDIRSDIPTLRVLYRHNNRGFNGQREYDLHIDVYRDGSDEKALNGSYYSLEIKPKTDFEIYADSHPAYKSLKLKITIPKRYFDTTASATITVCMGNHKTAIINVCYRYINILYIALMMIYMVTYVGFQCPEHYITFVLMCAAVFYNGPLSIYKLFRPNRVYIIGTMVLDNAFGGVLLFSTLSIFTLSRPWAPELLEGNVAIAWIFFVVTTFFKALPGILKLFGELSLSNSDGIPTLHIVGTILGGIFAFSLFVTQYKEYRAVPNNFRYRFWTCIEFAAGFAVFYTVVVLLEQLLSLISEGSAEFLRLGMVTGTSMIYCSLFVSRKLAPFNFFHNEDEKYKLE
ncbi:hypothetical protein TVAG_037600 [Trichomonas vaginalis G3]|uniref:Uncharacterized protein n=1 Tax=Trichomonas vaginalis (strain ATCC PRA-98 / G3) TaxID=412133 RepID=A2FCW7_TRIV3|nr:Wnt-binding factor required for Wnt secretion family [Trichomonas vaginalis G3]EAX97253.1 hypothetical protein TVAG_037600 [Trichomonas vaginalis G3]KAI5535852.1 Wnt-binding factor required for Wnt secretion family [Trichomonas vaginalis G3]|eukprot:XP_001310183.1 hypothetical protein [Trichomonas vaginalis G3]